MDEELLKEWTAGKSVTTIAQERGMDPQAVEDAIREALLALDGRLGGTGQ